MKLAECKLENGYSIIISQGLDIDRPKQISVEVYDSEGTYNQDLVLISNYIPNEDGEETYDEERFCILVPIDSEGYQDFIIDLIHDPETDEDEINELEDENDDYVEEKEVTQSKLIKPGDHGEEVKKIQQRLKDLGYFSGQVKGNYLTITTSAVEAFQKDAGLQIDGECDEETLARMFAENAPKRKVDDMTSAATPATGKAISKDWWKSDIQQIFSKGTIATITDVETGLTWRERRRGGTNHADVEPLTAADTAAFKKAAKKWSWDRRAVFVTINGVNYAASINCMPHGNGAISDNNFDGHHCVHFVNSRTHCSNKVCPKHQAAIKKALAATL